jgi:hypothetical protein
MYAYASSLTDRNEILQAMEEGIISEGAAAEQLSKMREQEAWEDLDTEEVEEYSKYLMDIAESSDLVSDELATNEEAAEDVARSVMRMNKGIEDLSGGYEEWVSVLRKSDKASQEFSKAMNSTKKAVADVLDTSEDFISDNFIQEHLSDIEKAAKGDEKAIENLRKALSEKVIAEIAVKNELTPE